MINTRFKTYCLGLLTEKFQRWDRGINIFLALVSSGSIAAWAVWQEEPGVWLWAFLIAASQVVTAIKPYFPYFKYVQILNKKHIQAENLNVEFERLWYENENEILTEKAIAGKFFELKKEMVKTFSYGDEIFFKVKQNIVDKANKKMKNYLLANFGVEINLNKDENT